MLSRMASVTVIAAAIAACAGAPERPTAEMTRAQTLIGQAESQGAQEFAAADLERAREKLRQAEAEANDGDTEASQRLALQAALDAEYAVARASSAEARKSADEMDRSIETLRREAARGVTPSPPLSQTPPPE